MTESRISSFYCLCDQAYNNAWGDLDLPAAAFSEELKRISEKHLGTEPASRAVGELFEKLHMNDLYLSVACAQASERAWDRFSGLYQNYIRAIARFVSASQSTAIDLGDNIVGYLFLPDRNAISRIASYDGWASLATWLRVIISRLAIKEGESRSNNNERLEAMPEIADEMSMLRIETGVRAGKYEALIKEAFKMVSISLTERERLILLLRYEERLPSLEIARLFEAHPSTITRQFQQIHKKVRAEFIAILKSRHLLSPAAVEECMVDALENPAHSLLMSLQ